MSGVPYIFANATTSIPLNQLDTNFATPVTIGNTTVALGNTVTILNGLANVGANVVGSTANVSFSIQSNATTAITVDTSQNVGIGTSSPAYKLHSAGTVGSGSTGTNGYYGLKRSSDGVELGSFNTDGTNIVTNSGANIVFQRAGTETARFDSSGYLLVGKGSTGNNGRIQSQAAGGTSFDTYEGFSNTGGFTFAVSGAGQIYAVSTTISAISDERLKENIRDLDDGLQTVMALKPRKYDWKEGKGADTKNARGFIAQEFETVFPDLIDEWREPAPEGQEPYKSVRQDLIPVLVKAIQEQQALITDMAAKLKSAGVAGF